MHHLGRSVSKQEDTPETGGYPSREKMRAYSNEHRRKGVHREIPNFDAIRKHQDLLRFRFKRLSQATPILIFGNMGPSFARGAYGLLPRNITTHLSKGGMCIRTARSR